LAAGRNGDLNLTGFANARVSFAAFPHQVSQDAVPERRACSVCAEEGSGDKGGAETFALSERLPIDIGKPQPQREFIQRQSQSYPEYDRNTQVPSRIARRQRGETGDHQQKYSPEQMMDMKAAFRDQIMDRQNVIMNDIGECPQEYETDNERNQTAQGNPPSETQFLVMMLQPGKIRLRSHRSQ
jgi:hypothetical protein